ncbi:MAG: hypothetical protein J6V52_05315 [Bacteroidaceae bacterium]|nr:hypothetical protein [Bacteroidaceae bacterium]
MASDLISRSALLAEYDRVHVGEPGGARKLMEAAPAAQNVIVLPCNIGDTLYEAVFFKDGTGSHIKWYTCCGIHIADKVTRWQYEKPVNYLVSRTEEGHSIKIRMEQLGKTLFLTREEAEDALKKGIVDEAPAVDAVEVVRCGDCERGEPSLIRKGEILCDWWRCHTRCDGFCHMGVKKDETD